MNSDNNSPSECIWLILFILIAQCVYLSWVNLQLQICAATQYTAALYSPSQAKPKQACIKSGSTGFTGQMNAFASGDTVISLII